MSVSQREVRLSLSLAEFKTLHVKRRQDASIFGDFFADTRETAKIIPNINPYNAISYANISGIDGVWTKV